MKNKNLLKLKKYPKSRCSKCGKWASYKNPVAKCFECDNKFCFDHIYSGQVKDGMKPGERVRDICEKCREIHGYKSVS